MTRFGFEVRQARHKQGLTLDKVARRTGTHKGYVSGIENDKVNPPSHKIIRKLAPILDVKEDRLLALAVIAKLPKRLPLSSLAGVCEEILAMQREEDRLHDAAAEAHSLQALNREAV